MEESFLFSLLSYALTPTLSPKGRGSLSTKSWHTVIALRLELARLVTHDNVSSRVKNLIHKGK